MGHRDRKDRDSDRWELERKVPSNVSTCPTLLPGEGPWDGRGRPLIFSDFKPRAGFPPKMVSFSESVLTPDVPRLIIDDKETRGCSSLPPPCLPPAGLQAARVGTFLGGGWGGELESLEGHGRLRFPQCHGFSCVPSSLPMKNRLFLLCRGKREP